MKLWPYGRWATTRFVTTGLMTPVILIASIRSSIFMAIHGISNSSIACVWFLLNIRWYYVNGIALAVVLMCVRTHSRNIKPNERIPRLVCSHMKIANDNYNEKRGKPNKNIPKVCNLLSSLSTMLYYLSEIKLDGL